MTIAGHTFVEDVNGKVCSCGIKWREIMGATKEHIGKPHWAHYQGLAGYEYAEIEAERDRVWNLLRCTVESVAAPMGTSDA